MRGLNSLFLLVSLYAALPGPAAYAARKPPISKQAKKCESYLTGVRRAHLTRLLLRTARADDLGDVTELIRDPDIFRYYFNRWAWHDHFPQFALRKILTAEPRTRADGKGEALTLVAQDKLTKKVIGIAALRWDLVPDPSQRKTKGRPKERREWSIGYAVGGPFRRQGYGRDIVEGLLNFIYSREPEAVVRAQVLEGNSASQDLLTSMGFEPDLGPNKRILGEQILYYVRLPSVTP